MDLLLDLLRLLALLFILTAPGYATARALWRDAALLSPGERIFLPLALSVLLSIGVGLLLAEFGIFSLGLLFALLLVWTLAAWLAGPRRPLWWWSRVELRPDWPFLTILALGALLALRPAEYVLGGYDAGVYVNIGAAIARTGGIAIHDPLLQSMPADPARQFLLDLVNPFMLYMQMRLPGFFVADGASGLVLPQFLHLYPVWLAIFDSAVGWSWGLYATPLLGLLSSAALYFVARALLGRRAARLAFFLLVIAVPQFWFARYPVSEMLMQFLLLTGMYAWLRSRGLALKTEDGVPGVGLPLLAAVCFADLFLTRADSILILAPIGLYALAVIGLRRWQREHTAFSIAFGALLIQAFVHIWVFSPDYVYFQYSHFLRMKNIDKVLSSWFGYDLPGAREFMSSPLSLLPLAAVAAAGLFALLLLDRLVQFVRKRPSARAARLVPLGTWARGGGAAFILALFLFGYFIWPHPTSPLAFVGGETTASRAGNLIKLGWYLSPIGLALAALGSIWVLLRDLDRRSAFFYGTGALFTVFYLEELYSNPHYIYTTRHYIPFVIPLLILLAVRGLDGLWQGWPTRPRLAAVARASAAAALALWLGYTLYVMGLLDASRAAGLAVRVPFLSESTQAGPVRLDPLNKSLVAKTELGGALDQVQALAERLDPRAVIIFVSNRDEPPKVATPLHFMFGRDALVARFNQPNGDKIADLIDGWQAEGRPVILAYGTNGGKLALSRYALEPVGHFTLDVPQLAFAYQFMPREFWQINLNYALYRPVLRTNASVYPYVVDFGGDDYPALARGFLERTTGEHSRWVGVLPDLDTNQKPKMLSGDLRFPLSGSGSTFYLALTVRAPQAGTRLALKSKTSLGEVTVGRDWETVQLTLPRESLRREGDTFLLTLSTLAFVEPSGRIVGVELQKAVLSEQPLAPGQ